MRKRRDRNRLNSAGGFHLRYNLPYSLLSLGRRWNMGDLSPQAKTRLAFLEFNHRVRNVSLTCQIFKISRQIFYKWQKRFSPENLSSLENQPKAPKTKRKGKLTFAQEMALKKFRERYIRQGKAKLAIMYEKEFGEKVSSWQFQRAIQRYRLYFDKEKIERVRTKKKRNQAFKKIRINEVNPSDYVSLEKPFFFCADMIVLYLPYGKRYILTAIDHFHKLGFARAYRSKSSLSAFDFLLRLNLLIDGKIAAILSDNGSEFAKYFEEACKKLKITHIYTRFRTPQDNPRDERFNRTVEEEFMEINENFESYLAGDDLTEANRELTNWLIFYNFTRPHQSLAYQTPMEYTHTRVSAMYPSSTKLNKFRYIFDIDDI
jgi:transposase InsO family protein